MIKRIARQFFNDKQTPLAIVLNPVSACVLAAVALIAPPVFGWTIPDNLGEVDDKLVWTSDAPSYNIYEDGNYIGTVHGVREFGPIFDNSVYQIAAHDHGTSFSPLSLPFRYLDDVDEGSGSGAESEELEFDAFELYFEVNNTDGDLGIHSLVDGDEWTRLVYEDLNGRTLIEINLSGPMAEQGLTELFFESTEPTFDDLPADVFFGRFPAGIYDVEGTTKDGDDIEAEAELSHVLPAAPVVYLGARPDSSYEGCVEDAPQTAIASLNDDGSFTVSWDPVTSSHPSLGVPGSVEVDSYLVVFEGESSKLSVEVNADQTNFVVPAALVSSGDEAKVEVLVKDSTHNQVATEACVQLL